METEVTIYDTLKSSCDRVHVQFRAESTKQLHDSLCSVWFHCAVRELGCDDITLICPVVTTEIVRLFRKMGIICYIDEAPSVASELSAHTTVIAGPLPWGTHTIGFSLCTELPIQQRCHCPF
jgi:hypothetical protein